MEDGSGGGPGGGTQFLSFDEVLTEVVTLYLCFILIEISISRPISCEIMYICIHGCNFFIHL